MPTTVRPLLIALLTLAVAAPATAAIQLQLVATSVPYIVDIQHAHDSRLFLVSQAGRILVWNGSSVLSTPFLDISSIVRFSGEQGLLGLAFHPGYSSSGVFFVHYTNTSGNTVVARYQVSANPNVADPMSAAIVLTQSQPFTNHKGGQMRFGPDGHLYIALGDGGSSGDPQNNGQRLDTLLGKLLRIDVTSAFPYAIPPTNPFVATTGARGEIWSYGLRNPWRFSFDRATGDMWIADVGQNTWEEVNFEPAATGGRNYGWRLMEGTHCFVPAMNCNPGSLTLPVIEYAHALGCSVTGGFRYRGANMPAFAGTYFYGDFCSGRIWSATVNSGGAWTSVQRLDTPHAIATFGEDAAGELYISHYDDTGSLYRIIQPGSGFTDEPLIPGTTFIKAVHVIELRVRIDTLRMSRGLASFAWSDSTLVAGSQVIRAAHVAEMRTALDEAYSAAEQPPPTYTDSTLTGAPVKAVHIAELRDAVVALE